MCVIAAEGQTGIFVRQLNNKRGLQLNLHYLSQVLPYQF